MLAERSDRAPMVHEAHVSGVERVLDELKAIGYTGWLVVEQDCMPDLAWPLELAAADQVANRAYLKRLDI